MRYALLVALLLAVASPLFARTIVLPVQPTVIDANGAEVPDCHAFSVDGHCYAEWSGAYYLVRLATGEHFYEPSAYDLSIGCTMQNKCIPCTVKGQAGTTYCFAPFPTFSFAAPMHVELR